MKLKNKGVYMEIISGILPTRSLLRRRNVAVPGLCPFCGDNEETVQHVFLNCTFAKQYGMDLL